MKNSRVPASADTSPSSRAKLLCGVFRAESRHIQEEPQVWPGMETRVGVDVQMPRFVQQAAIQETGAPNSENKPESSGIVYKGFQWLGLRRALTFSSGVRNRLCNQVNESAYGRSESDPVKFEI